MKLSNLIHKKRLTFSIGILVVILLIIQVVTMPKSISKDTEVSMTKHFENNVAMWVEVIGSQKRTQITIPFSFDKKPVDIWLNYQIENSKFNEYLIFHPLFQNLSWQSIRGEELTLYQKEYKYETIDEFIDNPQGLVFADPQIVLKYPEKNFQFITLDMDINSIDYILTTFTPIPQKYGTLHFEKIIDTSDAFIDEDNKMNWLVYVPRATQENTYNLGNIEVVYLQ